MQVLIRFLKLITFIPMVLFVILFNVFVLLVVYPINYIVKGPEKIEDSILIELAHKFGVKLDNWFKEK